MNDFYGGAWQRQHLRYLLATFSVFVVEQHDTSVGHAA
jgi:hypothetical protein